MNTYNRQTQFTSLSFTDPQADEAAFRERNNASWDVSTQTNPRNRSDYVQHSLASSPTSYFVTATTSQPIIVTQRVLPIKETPHVVIKVPVNVVPSVSKANDNDVEIENEQVIPDPKIYCMECDSVVDISAAAKHDEAACTSSSVDQHFKCDKCESKFNFERNLRAHKIVSHLTPFKSGTVCELCPVHLRRPFTRFSAYIGHVATHVQSDRIPCKSCEESFDSDSSLRKHVRHTHRDEPHELAFCPRCGEVVALEEAIAHYALHVTYDNLQTSSAKKSLPSTKNGREAKHECETCGKKFVRPSELKRHGAVHARKEGTDKIPKWKCSICGKEYAHETGLNEHKRTIHGDARKYTCSICGFSFTKQSNLDRHITRQHPIDMEELVSKPFECIHCPSVYPTVASLNHHTKIAHDTGSKKRDRVLFDRYKCTTCKKLFKTSSMLKAHHKLQHVAIGKRLKEEGKPGYACERCGKEFMLRASLIWHTELHARRDAASRLNGNGYPYCDVCNVEFLTKKEYHSHMAEHRIVKCRNCEIKFSSRNHYNRHICTRMVGAGPSSSTSRLPAIEQQASVFPYNSRLLVCRLCNPPQKFTTLRQMKEHKARHQPRKVHLCWTCHKSFRTLELLSLHKMVHNREILHCEHCDATFYSRIVFKQHMRTAHATGSAFLSVVHLDRHQNAASAQSFAEYGLGDEDQQEEARAQSVTRFEELRGAVVENVNNVNMNMRKTGAIRCEVCQHLYDNLLHLCNHWNENATERDHSFAIVTCPVCRLQIGGAAEVANHVQNHHFDVGYVEPPELRDLPIDMGKKREKATAPKRTVPCQYCGKTFGKKTDLTRHIRTHTDERPYICGICHASFRLKSTLKSHEVVHGDVLPEFDCSVCVRSFYDRKALRLHMRIHTGEQPISCGYCNQKFRTSSMRHKHEKKFHANSRLEAQFESSVVDSGTLQSLPARRDLYHVNPYPSIVNKASGLERTIGQVSTMPSRQLQLSSNSAFAAPSQETRLNETVYIVAKQMTASEYLVIVSRFAPPANSIRQAVDTVSAIELCEVQHSASISIVLHANMRLNVDTHKLCELIQSTTCDIKTRIGVGQAQSQDSIFEILPSESATFARRCDICEEDFLTRDQSDSHFLSEDHETAQLMFPMNHVPDKSFDATSLAVDNNYSMNTRKDELSDFTCKLCARKFFDMDLLVAHIRSVHEHDADAHIPPRPTAHTAPIH